MPCNPVGRDSEFMQVQHMELSRLGAPPEMLPLRRLRERLRRTVQSPLRIARRRAGWCCRSKGGPLGRIGRNGAAVCRVPCGRARTRHAFWTVLLLLLCSYPIFRVCRCVCYCLCAFQIPGSLRDYSPRYRVRPGHLWCRPEAVWLPIKTPSARYRSGSAGPRPRSRLAGWLSQRAFREGPPGLVDGSLHGCMAAWPLACPARAAVLSANKKIQPAKR